MVLWSFLKWTARLLSFKISWVCKQSTFFLSACCKMSLQLLLCSLQKNIFFLLMIWKKIKYGREVLPSGLHVQRGNQTEPKRLAVKSGIKLICCYCWLSVCLAVASCMLPWRIFVNLQDYPKNQKSWESDGQDKQSDLVASFLMKCQSGLVWTIQRLRVVCEPSSGSRFYFVVLVWIIANKYDDIEF